MTRKSVILVPIVTTAFALILTADVGAPRRSTVVEAAPTDPPACTSSLQTLIDATPTAGTLDVPACLFRETVTISRPMTINGYGSVIDGRDAAGNVVRKQWMLVDASDVTVRGFTMRYASNDYTIGALETAQTGVERFRLEDCDVSFAFININLTGTTDSEIRACAIHDAKHLGIRVAARAIHGARGNRIIDNRIYHNDRTGEPDPNADAGGLKATGQDELVLDGNVVFDNGEKGLWLDVSCLDATISNNSVHHNDTAGIMDETSTGTEIFGNVAWANGFGRYGAVWGWGAGILVSSSRDAEVWDNTLAWNYAGISVISQDRPDSPGVTGNHIHDNVIVEDRPTEGNDRFGLFWGQDWSGEMYAPESNNRGSRDRYFYPVPEDHFWRFVWDGGRPTLAEFNGTPGEQAGSYLTQSETEAILRGAGVPLVP
jgi:nitrous oxidase accessory protein NosD